MSDAHRHCTLCKHSSGDTCQGFVVCDYRTLQEANKGAACPVIAWSALGQANGANNQAEFCTVFEYKDGTESMYHAELRRRAAENTH